MVRCITVKTTKYFALCRKLQICEKLSEAHKQYSESEERMSERHKRQVLELSERHTAELEEQFSRYQEEAQSKEERVRGVEKHCQNRYAACCTDASLLEFLFFFWFSKFFSS